MSEPVRTCVACRTRRPQPSLLRLRRRPDGVVVPAVGRRTHGRSAYLCPSQSCLQRAIARRALERALSPGRATRGQSSSARPRVLGPDPTALWLAVAAALDHEIQNLQRSGDIRQSPRYEALVELHRGLGTPGRSA